MGIGNVYSEGGENFLLSGTSAAPLIRFLKLADRSAYGRKRLRGHLYYLRSVQLPKKLANLQYNDKYYFLGAANWELVWKVAAEAFRHKKSRDSDSQALRDGQFAD